MLPSGSVKLVQQNQIHTDVIRFEFQQTKKLISVIVSKRKQGSQLQEGRADQPGRRRGQHDLGRPERQGLVCHAGESQEGSGRVRGGVSAFARPAAGVDVSFGRSCKYITAQHSSRVRF